MEPLFAVWLWFAIVFSVLVLGLLLSALMSGEPPRQAFRRWLDRMLDILSFGVAISIIA
jgi:hypothetical protein